MFQERERKKKDYLVVAVHFCFEFRFCRRRQLNCGPTTTTTKNLNN